MRSNKALSALLLCVTLVLVAACGGGGGGGGDGGGSTTTPTTSCPVLQDIVLPNGQSLTPIAGTNVVTVTVNGSSCSAVTSANYPNKPCATITLCDAGRVNCQDISDILVDTGDNGLRIFEQAITNAALLASLKADRVQVGGQNLYECVEYGDGSTVWGPIVNAALTMGGVLTNTLPIQLTGSTEGNNRATVCGGSSLLLSPGPGTQQARYNGLLGVGLHARDCSWLSCVTNANNGFYYTCPGGTCAGSTAPTVSQVRNPVGALPADNNGVIVAMPAVPSTGAASVTGYLVFGIGTQANNTPSGVTAYGTTASGYFTTLFRGSTYTGFLDSGSNGLFFPNYGIPLSGSFYAPACALELSATNTGAGSLANTGLVNFHIENVTTLAATGNKVFSNLGAPSGTYFDWGFPFFLGRNVYVGIEGAASPLGTGPYWAY